MISTLHGALAALDMMAELKEVNRRIVSSASRKLILASVLIPVL